MSKKKPSKKVIWLLVVLALVSALLIYNILREERPNLMVVATGSPGGVYYPLGGAIAEVISRNLEGVHCDSESTSGSVENVRLVGNKESDLGMATENAAYKGAEGEYPFSRSYPIKALFKMYSAPLHIVTIEGTGIETIEDLAGKRVSIDAPGSGTEEMSRTLLEELDLLDQLRTENYGQQDAAAALRDGNIDAVFWNFAYPGSVVMEISARRQLHFIALEDEHIQQIEEKYAYYMGDVIPAGTYDNQEDDVAVISVNNILVVQADLDEELAYDITKVIFDNLERLTEVHDVAERISVETAGDTALEMHPGAVRLLEERSE